MAPENVELVERSYELLAELREAKPGTLERAFRECFDEGFEIRIPDAYPEGAQVFRGRAGVMRWVESTREVWDEWRFERERFLEAGDQVVVLVHLSARGKGSRFEIEEATADVFRLADGGIVQLRLYVDRKVAQRATGLAA